MKRVEDSKIVMKYKLRYEHMNGQGSLFGGCILQWIDDLAGLVAETHCGTNVITALADNILYNEPAYLNDYLTITGRVTYIGGKSLEVCTEAVATRFGDPDEHLINRAYFVMVPIDDERKPYNAPPLEVVSEEEKREWANGEKRYLLRKRRRQEGF